jgi:hypothetical protein
MKKRTLTLCIFAVSVLAISAFTLVNSNGTQTAYTLSPPDGPGDCSSCHGGGSATPVVNFTASPSFGAGNTYVPNSTYTLSMNVTGYPYFGFDLEMINGQLSTSKDAGLGWTNVSNCRITAAGTYPTNISHSTPVISSSSAKWTWKAPASGSVYVYACGLGVNRDGGTSGDKAADFTMTLNPSPLGVSEHSADGNNLNVFPNPVSSNLHVTYTLDKTSQVSVKLFDLSGKLVIDLFNQQMPAGEQVYEANLPSDISKGVYMLHLTVNGEQTVKRIVVK